MFDWGSLSGFEIGVTMILLAACGLGLAIYDKVSYLVRLKEIELRKKGLIEREDKWSGVSIIMNMYYFNKSRGSVRFQVIKRVGTAGRLVSR